MMAGRRHPRWRRFCLDVQHQGRADLKRVAVELFLMVLSAVVGAYCSQFIFPAWWARLDHSLYENYKLNVFGERFVLFVDPRTVDNPDDVNNGSKVSIYRSFCGWSSSYCLLQRMKMQPDVPINIWEFADGDRDLVEVHIGEMASILTAVSMNSKTRSVALYHLDTPQKAGYIGTGYSCHFLEGSTTKEMSEYYVYWGKVDGLVSDPANGTNERGEKVYMGLDKTIVNVLTTYRNDKARAGKTIALPTAC